MLANKRRSRQDKGPPQVQRIFGSRFAILGDYNVEHKADQDAAEHGDDKVAENPQKNPPSAHQQQKQKLEAGTIADSSGQTWTIVRWNKSRAAKPRPKPRFKRDRLCPPPKVGRFVPITPHCATGKRKAGNSSRTRTANSNESPIAKGLSSSAAKGVATAKANAWFDKGAVKALSLLADKRVPTVKAPPATAAKGVPTAEANAQPGNGAPIAKSIVQPGRRVATAKALSSPADKGHPTAIVLPDRLSPTAEATAQSVRHTATVKAVAEFRSKAGMGRSYRGVASASQTDKVARLNNIRARLGFGFAVQV